MPHYSFSLVFFTVLLQLVVGTIWLYICPTCTYRQGTKEDTRFWRTLLALLAIAFISSTTHLSNPFNAPYALTQASHSPLSREIWAFSIFGFLVLLRTFGLIKQKFDILIALASLPTLYIFSAVYTIATIPLLDNAITPLYFFASAFLLGGVSYSLFFASPFNKPAHVSTILGFILTIFVIVLASFKMIMLMNTPLNTMILAQAYHFASLLITALIFIVLGIVLYNSILIFGKAEHPHRIRIIISFVALLLGTILLRMLFYLLIPLRIGM